MNYTRVSVGSLTQSTKKGRSDLRGVLLAMSSIIKIGLMAIDHACGKRISWVERECAEPLAILNSVVFGRLDTICRADTFAQEKFNMPVILPPIARCQFIKATHMLGPI